MNPELWSFVATAWILTLVAAAWLGRLKGKGDLRKQKARAQEARLSALYWQEQAFAWKSVADRWETSSDYWSVKVHRLRLMMRQLQDASKEAARVTREVLSERDFLKEELAEARARWHSAEAQRDDARHEAAVLRSERSP